MSFGKRSAGDPRPPRPPIEPQAVSGSDVPSVRTRIANKGGIDTGFIAIAVGVVLLSAGGAIAAPTVLTLFDAGKPRPIAELVTGLERDEMKVVLATEAFPDAGGRAFMQSLKQHFPDSHQRLLGQMARTAGAGGDRDDLVLGLAQWGMEFGPANFEYVGRTGAEGFDSLLSLVSDSFDVVRKEVGGCSLTSLQRLAEDPTALQGLTRYGSEAYKITMRANQTFVELAARGRNAPKPAAKLNADDENALQSVFFSIMMDPQIMQLAQQAMGNGGGTPEDMQLALASKMDVCQLGSSVIGKLERLPSGTKSRLLAVAFSGDLAMMQGPMMGMGGYGAPPEVMSRLEGLR